MTLLIVTQDMIVKKLKRHLETRPDFVQKVANFLNLSSDQIQAEKPHMVGRLRTAIKNGLFGQPASDNVGTCTFLKILLIY